MRDEPQAPMPFRIQISFSTKELKDRKIYNSGSKKKKNKELENLQPLIKEFLEYIKGTFTFNLTGILTVGDSIRIINYLSSPATNRPP